jgi:cyclomaltodextrinase / maltogenic alpha-amylase / neopullulanase
MKQGLKIGKYKHYKGKLYEVIGTAYHSETLEELVVYRALYMSSFGENVLWVRPKKMFIENVEINGKSTPRFKFVTEKLDP